MSHQIERISDYSRFRLVLSAVFQLNSPVSAGLERRIENLLEETEDVPPINQKNVLKSYLQIMKRVKQEICEVFVTDIIDQLIDIHDGVTEVTSMDVEFPFDLYKALESCIEQGINGKYNWTVGQDESEDAFFEFETIELSPTIWHDLITEGAGTELFVKVLHQLGVPFAKFVNGHNEPIEDFPGNDPRSKLNTKPLTEAQKQLRPSESIIEPIRNTMMASLAEIVEKRIPPEKIKMETCKLMIQYSVDPSFIYAFQMVGQIITQERSNVFTEDQVSAWDHAVELYRSNKIHPTSDIESTS